MVYNSFSFTVNRSSADHDDSWKGYLLKKTLPRHYELIQVLNFMIMSKYKKQFSNKPSTYANVSLVTSENGIEHIRLARIAFLCSHKVIGQS